MKIELQDYKQPLKTHDVNLEHIIDIRTDKNGVLNIAHYPTRKSRYPVSIKVKESMKDILMIVLRKGGIK